MSEQTLDKGTLKGLLSMVETVFPIMGERILSVLKSEAEESNYAQHLYSILQDVSERMDERTENLTSNKTIYSEKMRNLLKEILAYYAPCIDIRMCDVTIKEGVDSKNTETGKLLERLGLKTGINSINWSNISAEDAQSLSQLEGVSFGDTWNSIAFKR